jgi:hypothetical protein
MRFAWYFVGMNPVSETAEFAELLTHTLARANQLPNDELGQTLRSAIALSVLGNDILGKILASQAASIGQLSQMLADLSMRLDQIQTTLAILANWAKEQQHQQSDDSRLVEKLAAFQYPKNIG